MATPNIEHLADCVADSKDAIEKPGRPSRLARRLATRIARLRAVEPRMRAHWSTRIEETAPYIRRRRRVPDRFLERPYAAHALACAVMSALTGTDVRRAFFRMQRVLKSMQTETEGIWGPA